MRSFYFRFLLIFFLLQIFGIYLLFSNHSLNPILNFKPFQNKYSFSSQIHRNNPTSEFPLSNEDSFEEKYSFEEKEEKEEEIEKPKEIREMGVSPGNLHCIIQKKKERTIQDIKTWDLIYENREINPNETAIIIMDMWNKHTCKDVAPRSKAMIEKMNPLFSSAREMGMLIVHAPTEVTRSHMNDEAYQRIKNAKITSSIPPKQKSIPWKHPLIGACGGGLDGFQIPTRQHPDLSIDQDHDILTEDINALINYLLQRNIHNVFYAGVHSNMCLVSKPVGIMALISYHLFDIYVLTDLTDAMFAPSDPPFLTIDDANTVIIGEIQRIYGVSALNLTASLASSPHLPVRSSPTRSPTWIFYSESFIYAKPTLIGDLLVCFGSFDGNMYCLSQQSGTVISRHHFGKNIFSHAATSSLATVTSLFVGTWSGTLARLDIDHVDKHKMTLVYEAAVTNDRIINGAPLILEEQDSILFGAQNHALNCISLSTGQLKWKVMTGWDVVGTPISLNSLIIFTSQDGNLYAVNAESGLNEWTYTPHPEDPPWIYSTPLILSDSHDLIYTSFDGTLYCIDADNGVLSWKFKFPMQMVSSPTINLKETTIYVTSLDHCIYSFDLASKTINWKYCTEGPLYSGVAIDGNDDTLYFGSFDATLYALDITGKIVWSYTTDGPIYATPVINHNTNKLFVSSLDYRVYSFDL